MFLSTTDLVALTGYKKPALQRRWLVANGYKFDVRADGRPAVLCSAVESKLASRGRIARDAEPHFDAIGI